jgi:anti-sigma factor RsiW
MHQLIQDGLEDYLSGSLDSASRTHFETHLANCPACREEVEAMQSMSSLFESLRDPAPVVPDPGFYARVSARIEQEEESSLWSLLIQPLFARRLALASLLFLALVGGAFLSGDPEYMTLPSAEQVIAMDEGYRQFAPPPDTSRGHMMYTLASYQQ